MVNSFNMKLKSFLFPNRYFIKTIMIIWLLLSRIRFSLWYYKPHIDVT